MGSTTDSDLAESLFKEHGPQVLALGYRFFAGKEDDARDLVSETFARVLVALPRFRGESSHATWIMRIAMNVIADFLRKKKVRAEKAAYVKQEEYDVTTPSSQFRKVEVKGMVNHALQSLSPDHRIVLSLILLEGVSQEEAAELIGVPFGTLRSRYARARIAFAEEMRKTSLLDDMY